MKVEGPLRQVWGLGGVLVDEGRKVFLPYSWVRHSSVLRDNKGMCLPGVRVHVGCHRKGSGRNRLGPGLRCL